MTDHFSTERRLKGGKISNENEEHIRVRLVLYHATQDALVLILKSCKNKISV
jgi:hypothetical protein